MLEIVRQSAHLRQQTPQYAAGQALMLTQTNSHISSDSKTFKRVKAQQFFNHALDSHGASRDPSWNAIVYPHLGADFHCNKLRVASQSALCSQQQYNSTFL